MPRTEPTDVDLKFCETHVTMKLVLHDGTIYRLASARITASPMDNPTEIPSTFIDDGGFIPAGSYALGYTFTNAYGETLLSPLEPINTFANDRMLTLNTPDLPEGVTGINWYLSESSGSVILRRATVSGGEIASLPIGSDPLAPTVNTSGETYLAHLMKDSEVKTSLTSLADQASVGAQNVDRELGLTINDVSQTLTNAKVTFSKVFKQDAGTWDRKVLLHGVVSNVEIDENLAEIKIVSDVAPNVAFIGTRKVQEMCPLVFKGRACGYVGPLTTCNKVFDSADGCLGRDNQPRFGGAKDSGELGSIIIRGIDIPIGGGIINHGGDGTIRFYPDPVGGRHRQLDQL